MDINWLVVLILPFIGYIGMFAGGYWGVGCGWLIVPTLLIFGFTPTEAVSVGLLQMVPSTFLTVVKDVPVMKWGKGSVGRSLVIPLGVGAFLTAFSGQTINDYLYAMFGSKALLVLFCFVTSFIGIKTYFGKYNNDQTVVPQISAKQSAYAFGGGLVTGMFSSLLGIGGAMFFRPILANGFRIPEHITSKSVRILLFLTTLTGGLYYAFSNGVGEMFKIFILASFIAVGGMIGFPRGVRHGNIVCANGYSVALQKSFSLISIIVLTNTLVNLAGYVIFSRYMVITFAAGLYLGINLFVGYTRRHVRTISSP